jgi:hypothetical protein
VTEQRDLKRLVRERMARTGESYSTARRHVAAHATPEAAGSHRLSAVVVRLLERAGITDPRTGAPFTEAMVCGLAGGIGFMYAVFEYKGLPPMVTIVAQHHPDPWAPAALRRAGVAFTEAHSGTPKPALTALRRDLDAGRAVLCTVSRGRLPWYPGDPFDADPFPVLVTAGSDDEEVVVDDGPRQETVPVDTLVSAWTAHKKGRHHRITIDGAASRGDLAIRDAVATTVAHLTGPVLGNAFDVNFGLSGMSRFAEQLADERGKTGWARRFADPAALATGLRRVHEGLERELTAPGATRPLYAQFLEEAGVAPEAAAAYREAGACWSALAAEALATAQRVTGERVTAERVNAERVALDAKLAGDGAERSASSENPTTALRRLADVAHDAVAAERTAVTMIAKV